MLLNKFSLPFCLRNFQKICVWTYSANVISDEMWQMNLRSSETMESGPYPERPGEPDCSYYIRTGLCRFGATCRFNHPPNRKLVWAFAYFYTFLSTQIYLSERILMLCYEILRWIDFEAFFSCHLWFIKLVEVHRAVDIETIAFFVLLFFISYYRWGSTSLNFFFSIIIFFLNHGLSS